VVADFVGGKLPFALDGDQTSVAEMRGLLTRADLLLNVQH